jgi:hypothetical protein
LIPVISSQNIPSGRPVPRSLCVSGASADIDDATDGLILA